MNEPIYGCAGCQTTAGAGGCPVHSNLGKEAPTLSLKPPGVIVTPGDPAVLRAEIEQKNAYIRELSDALEETRKERDAALHQLGEAKKLISDWLQHECSVGGPSWEEIESRARAMIADSKCPSTYTHSTHGTLHCEKDVEHLNRRGDVEHKYCGIKWMSI